MSNPERRQWDIEWGDDMLESPNCLKREKGGRRLKVNKKTYSNSGSTREYFEIKVFKQDLEDVWRRSNQITLTKDEFFFLLEKGKEFGEGSPSSAPGAVASTTSGPAPKKRRAAQSGTNQKKKKTDAVDAAQTVDPTQTNPEIVSSDEDFVVNTFGPEFKA